MKHGALDYKECVGDDLAPKMGGMESLPFPTQTGLAADEALIFSFIAYSSRQHRDEVNANEKVPVALNPGGRFLFTAARQRLIRRCDLCVGSAMTSPSCPRGSAAARAPT